MTTDVRGTPPEPAAGSSSGLAADGVRWGTRHRQILDGVSVSVAPGRTVGLLGPNGSGKSSLLRVLAGLRTPSRGEVRLAGRPLHDLPRKELARRLAVVEQEVSSSLDLRVRNVIELGRIPHRKPWAPTSPLDRRSVHEAAELTALADKLDQPYSTLSGGERQRVQIARALAQQPDVLLLDEPTNHLDVRHQLSLMDLVRRTSVTTLVALHDLNLAAAYCDEVYVLAHGRVVVAGAPSEVLTRDLIAEVYGVEARVRQESGEALNIQFLSPSAFYGKVSKKRRGKPDTTGWGWYEARRVAGREDLRPRPSARSAH